MGWEVSLFSVASHLHGEEQLILGWGTKCSPVVGLSACCQRQVVDHYSGSQSNPHKTDGCLLPLTSLITWGLLCHISFIQESNTHYILRSNYRLTIRCLSTALTNELFYLTLAAGYTVLQIIQASRKNSTGQCLLIKQALKSATGKLQNECWRNWSFLSLAYSMCTSKRAAVVIRFKSGVRPIQFGWGRLWRWLPPGKTGLL